MRIRYGEVKIGESRMSLLEHAKRELYLAGYNIDRNIDGINNDNDYSDICAKCAYEMLERFVREGHSGFSASVTLDLFNKLARYKRLTPLTSNPNEWEDVSKISNEACLYQSKRQSSCFSEDGLQTYYDIDADENFINTEDGRVLKDKTEWVRHPLISHR